MQEEQIAARKIEESPARGTTPLDLRTHVRNAKTGGLMRTQFYTLRVRDGVRYFEMPKGSGNLFFESGEKAGRFIPGAAKNEAGQVDTQAKHIAYTAPTTPQDRFEAAARENEALRKELELLKSERESEQAPVVKGTAPKVTATKGN